MFWDLKPLGVYNAFVHYNIFGSYLSNFAKTIIVDTSRFLLYHFAPRYISTIARFQYTVLIFNIRFNASASLDRIELRDMIHYKVLERGKDD
jgi:hypothetical protein